MKKFVTLGLVAVLGVALATGCKKKEETTTETTTTTESTAPAVVQETGTTATTTTMISRRSTRYTIRYRWPTVRTLRRPASSPMSGLPCRSGNWAS